MKSAVILFPGLNRDLDMIAALGKISGKEPAKIWHTDTEIGDVDLIVVPGGFSYGDYPVSYTHLTLPTICSV